MIVCGCSSLISTTHHRVSAFTTACVNVQIDILRVEQAVPRMRFEEGDKTRKR